MTEFAVFVKTLTGNVSSLLKRFQESRTFEEKIDKEIKKLEANIRRKLQEFDKALEETTSTSTGYLVNFAQSITNSFAKLSRARNIVRAVTNTCRDVSATRRRGKLNKPPKKFPQNVKEDSQACIQDTGDSQSLDTSTVLSAGFARDGEHVVIGTPYGEPLEKIFNCSVIKLIKSDEEKSQCLMNWKA